MPTDDLERDLRVLQRVAKKLGVSPLEFSAAQAIGRQENDANFGVRSVKVANQEQAARVLFNSLRNNVKRWEQAGKTGDFIDFMGSRWAPSGAENDPTDLNKNWAPGVKSILKRDAPSDVYEQAKGAWNLP